MGKMRVSGSFYVTMAAKDGEKGEPGSDGKGISQEMRYYQRSSSNSTAPTSWVTTPPALTSTYRYLWSYIKTTYTDGSTNSTTPAVIGVYGDTGRKGDKGARMIMLYWSECANGFPFYSGKEGEEYYHVVFESRSDTLRTSTCYLCISSYTKSSSSALPSKDTTHWLAFENVALIATDLMLSRKIAAEEIDVDSLTVRNVHAVSSDGNTTCHIDGETGKLTAKNADFQGKVTSNEGSIGGFEIADNRLGYNPFPSVMDGTPYVNMTKSEFNAWSEYFNPSDGGAVSKSSTLTAGYIETKITDSRTGYYQEHIACKFIAGNYGLKVTNTGIYMTSDGGNTWSLFGVS